MAAVDFSIAKSHSVLLDSTGEYIVTPFSTYGYIGNGDMTIEFWFKTKSTDLQGLFFTGQTASNDHRLQMEISAAGGTSLYVQATTSNQSIASASGLISINTWYHLALVKQRSSITIYLNGNSVATGSVTVIPIIANNLHIGLARSGNVVRYFNGYISNFRVVEGSAVYTGNFTPPTEPLFVIPNTTFLTCQSSTIVDNSYNQYLITTSGSPQVDPENPFGFTTSTSVSADLFDDISTTDSVINQMTLSAKSVFDIIDIQSGIDAPVNAIGTDELTTKIALAKSVFDIIDIQTAVDTSVNPISVTEFTTKIALAKSVFDIVDIQSGIDAPVNAIGVTGLIAPTILAPQQSRQYDRYSVNDFLDNIPMTSSMEAVNISKNFLNKRIIERVSPQKLNTLRILNQSTQTVVNYSYWI